MSTSIAALEANNISIEQANVWVLSQLNNPAVIFNTAKAFGLTSSDIASIVSYSIPNVNSDLVEQVISAIGLDSSELTGVPASTNDDTSESDTSDTTASVTDPILSNAEIHQLIQAKINFEDVRGVEIIQQAAAADIQSSYDGEAAIYPGQANYDQLVAEYNDLDFEEEVELIELYIEGVDLINMHFSNAEYNQTFRDWASELNHYQDMIKATYDDVLRINDDYVVDLADDSGDINNPNNDLVIFDTQADQAYISNFSDNDDLYIFNGLSHFLGAANGSVVETAKNWAMSNSAELSDNVIDFFIIDDGSATHIVGEKVANQTYDSSTDASDFSIITLNGVAASDLAYNDGFIAYA